MKEAEALQEDAVVKAQKLLQKEGKDRKNVSEAEVNAFIGVAQDLDKTGFYDQSPLDLIDTAVILKALKFSLDIKKAEMSEKAGGNVSVERTYRYAMHGPASFDALISKIEKNRSKRLSEMG